MNSPLSPIDAVILAAGASVRMGRDKATMAFDGHCFLEHCVLAVAGPCRRIVIVLGFHADAIESEVRPRLEEAPFASRLLWVRNPDPERGRFSSLQTGLRALDPAPHAVVVHAVDHPAVRPATVETLLEGFAPSASAPAEIVKPAFRGRSGHPVLYGPAALAAIADLPSDATAREMQQRFLASIRKVEVDDPGILWNLDTPEIWDEFLTGR